MSFLLDTDVCIAFLNGRDRRVERAILDHSEDVTLCSVVKAELLYGARHGSRAESNLKKLASFFAQFPSIPFDDEAADAYGKVRAHLRLAGTPIGAYDLQIAAIALAADMAVVTRNRTEFLRVPGLRVTTW